MALTAGTYTATQLNDMGAGAANNAPSGSTINIGGVPYIVYDTGSGTRNIAIAPNAPSGSASTNADTGLRSLNLSDTDKAALNALYAELRTLTPGKFEAEATAELTPYYDRLLKESNYDVNVAKKRLEEDYNKGLRQKADDVKAQIKQLVGFEFPAEQKAKLEDLNQRGMLGGVTDQNAPGRTVNLVQATDTGTATAPIVPGQPVTGAYNPNVTNKTVGTVTQGPVTTAQFGGLAGKQMGDVTSQQDARQEAITRAFTRYNEDQAIDRSRKMTDYTTEGARKERNLTQERNEKIPTLAGEKLSRKLAENAAKRQIIVEPAQLKLSGLSF